MGGWVDNLLLSFGAQKQKGRLGDWCIATEDVEGYQSENLLTVITLLTIKIIHDNFYVQFSQCILGSF